MKNFFLLIGMFLLPCLGAYCQIEKLWETNLPVGGDSLEVLFYKQDSSGNHYTGGSIGRIFFVSKFNSSGIHQWTVSENRLIDKKVPSFETRSIIKSRLSDITFLNDKVYLSGSKHYETQGEDNFNFIIVLDSNGDSIAFVNILDPVNLTGSFDISGQRPFIRMHDSEVYLFTALHNGSIVPGVENISLFKFNNDLDLLKHSMFSGIVPFGRDQIADVKIKDNVFYISSLHGAWQRNLACDTSLSIVWESVYKPLATAKHSVLPLILYDSILYTFINFRDTARKDTQSGLGAKIQGQVRRYDLSGNFLDSFILNKSNSSNDSLVDAIIDNEGNLYAASVTKDSNRHYVLVTKLNRALGVEKVLFFEKSRGHDVRLLVNGCKLYASLADSFEGYPVLKLLRFDTELNTLSQQEYFTGTNKVSRLGLNGERINLLSIGRSASTDTLSLKLLKDTIQVAEPSVFSSGTVTPRSIELIWQLAPGLADSIVIFKRLNNSWNLLAVLPASIASFIDNNLTPSTRYDYRVRSRWQSENSCNTLILSDSTPFNTGVVNTEFEPFLIYPNPANSELSVEHGNEGIEEIELLSTTGAILHSFKGQTTVSLKHLAPGIYFIRINKNYTYKIIKL